VLLREKLLEAGWCYSTVEYMQEKLPLQVQALAYSLGSARMVLDHPSCELDTMSGCKFSQVGPDYRPKHVDLTCPCALIHSPIAEIVGMLKENTIPLITIRKSATETDSPFLELVVDGIDLDHPEFEQYSCPYVAVAHVWSNGLGNMLDNASPTVNRNESRL
jgi:hypothetical protein